MEEFQYKVIEANDDCMKAVVEKSGMSSTTFTLQQLLDQRKKWSQEKRQLEGQLIIETGTVENIEHHHPWVKDMDEQKQYTVWMYYEAMKTKKGIEKEIANRVAALDEYVKEENTVMEKLGFQKTDMPTE